MLIAIPSDPPGGLEAPISEHFGHCAVFTLVAVEDGRIGEVSLLPNSSHEEGGCMAPVNALKARDVDVLVAGGMGMRPLAGFQQVGISVHFKENATAVGEAVELFLAGQCRAHGAEHVEVVREPIVGPADIRTGRIVTLAYTLKDAAGNPLDGSDRSGPMRYLHGAGRTLPALERAVAGLEPGAKMVVELTPEQAFGARDESRIVEAPREQLPPDVQVGMTVTAEDEGGRRFMLRVIALDDAKVTLDGNHPLAGLDLVFEVEVLAVETATAEEIAHGHPH
jgi:FKBP-type peptidyl-prolyl cis-trans isomerase 2/predicted Fe-Mo cluster-binding NifX family protein